jgi:hypothetical protein
MSQELLTEIIGKASADEKFRTRLIDDMETTLKENNWLLTEQEKELLRNIKVEESAGEERSLDTRVSKALYGTDTHGILW